MAKQSKSGRFRQEPSIPNYFEHGKVPPQAVDLEEAILGAILLEKDALEKASELIPSEEIFYKESHQLIYKAIRALVLRSDPVDILTVTNELKSSGELELIGGPYYISEITNRIASGANIEYHIGIVRQKYLQRQLIAISSHTIKEAFEDTTDPFELLDKVMVAVDDIDPRAEIQGKKNTVDVVEQVSKQVRGEGEGIPIFFATHWPRFDHLVGTSRNRIVLIAGANGDGKSRFLSAWMSQLLLRHEEMAIQWHQYEDEAMDVYLNYMAHQMKMKTKLLKAGKIDKNRLEEYEIYANNYRKFDIEYHEERDRIRNVGVQFSRFCRQRKNKFNVLIIDNILSLLDKVDFKRESNEMYDYICAELLAIKQRTKGMIVIVHHYNDAQQGQERLKSGYRPTESDIKGTEAFRRIAHAVCLLNNPGRRRDLLMEYDKDRAELLSNMFIIDVTKTRDENNQGLENLIYMFKTLDYNTFVEIETLN